MEKEKKKYLFIISIVVIGIFIGIIFANVINKADKILVEDKLTTYFLNIKDNKNINYFGNLLNSFLNNNLYLIIIWLLGLSIIGIVLNNFIIFFKSFVIGFSIGSIINVYLYKGIIGALIYIFPHHIINILVYVVLIYHANNFSIKLFKTLFLKQDNKIKELMPKYLKILLYCFIALSISALLETFLSPFIIKFWTFTIK